MWRNSTGFADGDIDFKNNVIHVSRTATKDAEGKPIIGDSTKTYSGTRTIEMFESVREVLKKNTNIDYLFLSSTGKPLNASNVNASFKVICKDAGIRPCIYELHRKGKIIKVKSSSAHMHMLRHQFATRAVEAGVNPEALKETLGHKHISTTMDIYAEATDQLKKEEAKKMEEYLLSKKLS